MTSVGYCWRYESDVQDGLDELLILDWRMNENPTKIIGSMFHFLELITMHVIARKRYPILISYIFIYSLSQSFFPNVVLCSWRHDFILLLKSPLMIQKKKKKITNSTKWVRFWSGQTSCMFMSLVPEEWFPLACFAWKFAWRDNTVSFKWAVAEEGKWITSLLYSVRLCKRPKTAKLPCLDLNELALQLHRISFTVELLNNMLNKQVKEGKGVLVE